MLKNLYLRRLIPFITRPQRSSSGPMSVKVSGSGGALQPLSGSHDPGPCPFAGRWAPTRSERKPISYHWIDDSNARCPQFFNISPTKKLFQLPPEPRDESDHQRAEPLAGRLAENTLTSPSGGSVIRPVSSRGPLGLFPGQPGPRLYDLHRLRGVAGMETAEDF